MVTALSLDQQERQLVAELIRDRSSQDLGIEQGRFRLANSISNLLLAKGDTEVYNRKWPWHDTWIDQEAQTNHQLATWLMGPIKAWSMIIMYWANCDRHNAREFLIYFSQRPEPKPDLSYFLTNWLVALGLVERVTIQAHQDPECQQQFARALRHLLVALDWRAMLNDPRVNVQNMSGFRDTILGSYPVLKTIDVAQDAEHYWDIGGGHHTPWLNKLVPRPWHSLDLQPAHDVGAVTLRRVNLEGNLVLLEGAALEEYLALLADQPWTYYNVFEHELPPAKSTVVVSTGFIASTMTDINQATRPPEWQFDLRMDQGKLVTYMGVYGMLAPLYQGGDLEIVTVSRPSGYATKWLLVQLAWKQGQLVKQVTEPWPTKGTTGIRGFTLKVKQGRRDSIDPLGTRWQHLEQGEDHVG